MLLRIIDSYIPGCEENSLQIILENESTTESFTIESYSSPFSDNFYKTLDWYFKSYLQASERGSDDMGVAEKLIKFGQYMGDELLGEDHQLTRFINIIERQGYENLQVQFESGRVEFFKELWETAILPESKYVLAAAVKGYVRQFVGKDFPTDFPELHYNLKANAPSQDKVARILQGNTTAKKNISPHKPLRILYVISRPDGFELPFASSNCINLCFDAIVADGAIVYEIHQSLDWEQLQIRLADKNQPIHILHYDGPVIVEHNTVSFALANSTDVNLHSLTKVLAGNKVGALSVDARLYIENNQQLPAAKGLAMIAQIAHQNGFGNVIGLSEITNPWTSSQCFKILYSNIVKGLCLAQAVVESRKNLQAKIESDLVTAQPISFHTWPLLVHYSKQLVTFFESQQSFFEPAQAEGMELFRDKLFGFRTEMLPPLLNQKGDSQILKIIDQLAIAKKSGVHQIASIIGGAGTGKSQLAHVLSLYLAQTQKIDYGFYFNFALDDYLPNDMLEMIAPVLSLRPDQRIETDQKLSMLHCCFVMDGISSDNTSSWELLEFFQKLASYGHVLVIIGESDSELHTSASVKIETTPLHFFEQQIIAADTLRQSNLTDIGQDNDYIDLLSRLNGNPWLIKRTIPLLRNSTINDLSAQLELRLGNQPQVSVIDQFYEWQWSELKPVQQQLLVLCGDVRGLLLEMLMTTVDQKEPFQPAKNLFALLGEDHASFSDLINIWETSGFLCRFPHGRMIDTRCIDFLQKKREQCFQDIDQTQLKFCFSQVICESIRLLSGLMIKQPNQNIVNNLLFNRRNWVEHFENLWFGEDFRGFIAVKDAFNQVLQQAKLENESKIWLLDLLERSPVVTTDKNENSEAVLCWLAVASNVLSLGDAKNSKNIQIGAENWRSWFDSFTDSGEQKELILLQQVAMFLQTFYQSHCCWNDCIAICEKSYSIYFQHQAWHRVIHSLKSLSKFYFELGDKDKVLIFENKIINEIPYSDAPAGFQIQQMLDILFARISRADNEKAQLLLHQIRTMDGADRLADILDGVQCDIDYQEENYLAVLPYYCKVWPRALESKQQGHIEKLRARMIELEQKIGIAYFDEYFEREVAIGTPKPKDYVSSLH